MKAKLYKNGTLVAEVEINGMHRNLKRQNFLGNAQWLLQPNGSWYSFISEDLLDESCSGYSLEIEGGEMATFKRVKNSRDDGYDGRIGYT
jgi:hypothetical protein